MSTYNPSTGLLDVEETPFRLFQADDAIITNTLTLDGVIIDPTLQVTVEDLSGVVTVNQTAITANANAITAIKGTGYTNQTIKGNADDIATNLASINTNTTAIATKVAKAGDTMTGLLQTASGIKFNAGVPTSTTQTLYYDAGTFGIGAGLKFGTDNITDLFNRMNTAEGTIISNTNGINTNSTAITNIKGTGYTNQTIKGNADAIATNTTNINTNASAITAIKGTGYTNQTIKQNADDIATNTAAISSNTSGVAGKVNKSGDTMTGNLTLQSTAPRLIIDNTNNTRSGDTYLTMANDGYWELYSESNRLLSGRNNAINFHASAGAYFDGNLVFSGDNQDVVISKVSTGGGSSNKSLRLQAGDDSSSTITDDFAIELIVREDNPTPGVSPPTYTAMKVNGKSQQIEINRDMTIDDTRGIIFEGSTTPSSVTNKLHRRSDGLYYENDKLNLTGVFSNQAGMAVLDSAYVGVQVGNNQLFSIANTGGIQGQIGADSGTTNGFKIKGRANSSDNTQEDKMFFNSANCGFNIGGSTTQLNVGTDFVNSFVKLRSDNSLIFRDPGISLLTRDDIGSIIADQTNSYFNIKGLPASGSTLEDKIRVGRTTTTFYDLLTFSDNATFSGEALFNSVANHNDHIVFGVDDKGIKFKDGASTKLLTYNTTANALQFDGANVGGNEDKYFTTSSITAVNVLNNMLLRPVGSNAFSELELRSPYSGGGNFSLFISQFNSSVPAISYGSICDTNNKLRLSVNATSFDGTADCWNLEYTAASKRMRGTLDMDASKWVPGAFFEIGAIEKGKFTAYDYNDGTKLIDNNKVRVRTNNNDVLLIHNNTDTIYQDGDVIILQQRRGSGTIFDENNGGLRWYNPVTEEVWAMFTNDARDLNFNVNGNNKSFINNTGSDTQLNFTAFHRSVVEDNITTNWESYTGLIVETTGEYNNIFYDKNEQNARYTPAVKEALPNVRLTTKLGSKAVFGILSNKEELRYNNTQRTYNTGGYQGHLYDIDTNDPVEMDKRYDIASVGECAVWIIKTAGWENPENGDLFMSSDKQAGYGQIQPDGVVKNITVGKLTCSWDNPNLKARQLGDYTAKLMGCVLYCG